MQIKDKTIFNGLYHKNPILISGLIAAPLIVCASTLKMGIVLIIAFSLLTFITISISSLLPHRIVYTLRIILYTIVSTLVYVPIYLLCNYFFEAEVEKFGIYMPLLVVNSLIVSQSELLFFKKPKNKMIYSLLFYILGFDLVTFIYSIIREMISFGTINDRMVGVSIITDGFSKPFGGFILLGIFSAILRYIMNIAKRWKAKT